MKIKLTHGDHYVCGEGYSVIVYKAGDVFEIKDSDFKFLADKAIIVPDEPPLTEEEKELEEIPLDRLNASYVVKSKLKAFGYDTLNKIAKSSIEELSLVQGIGEKTAEKVLYDARKAIRE